MPRGSECGVAKLPKPIVTDILDELELPDLLNLRKVSRAWREASSMALTVRLVPPRSNKIILHVDRAYRSLAQIFPDIEQLELIDVRIGNPQTRFWLDPFKISDPPATRRRPDSPILLEGLGRLRRLKAPVDVLLWNHSWASALQAAAGTLTSVNLVLPYVWQRLYVTREDQFTAIGDTVGTALTEFQCDYPVSPRALARLWAASPVLSKLSVVIELPNHMTFLPGQGTVVATFNEHADDRAQELRALADKPSLTELDVASTNAHITVDPELSHCVNAIVQHAPHLRTFRCGTPISSKATLRNPAFVAGVSGLWLTLPSLVFPTQPLGDDFNHVPPSGASAAMFGGVTRLDLVGGLWPWQDEQTETAEIDLDLDGTGIVTRHLVTIVPQWLTSWVNLCPELTSLRVASCAAFALQRAALDFTKRDSVTTVEAVGVLSNWIANVAAPNQTIQALLDPFPSLTRLVWSQLGCFPMTLVLSHMALESVDIESVLSRFPRARCHFRKCARCRHPKTPIKIQIELPSLVTCRIALTGRLMLEGLAWIANVEELFIERGRLPASFFTGKDFAHLRVLKLAGFFWDIPEPAEAQPEAEPVAVQELFFPALQVLRLGKCKEHLPRPLQKTVEKKQVVVLRRLYRSFRLVAPQLATLQLWLFPAATDPFLSACSIKPESVDHTVRLHREHRSSRREKEAAATAAASTKPAGSPAEPPALPVVRAVAIVPEPSSTGSLLAAALRKRPTASGPSAAIGSAHVHTHRALSGAAATAAPLAALGLEASDATDDDRGGAGTGGDAKRGDDTDGDLTSSGRDGPSGPRAGRQAVGAGIGATGGATAAGAGAGTGTGTGLTSLQVGLAAITAGSHPTASNAADRPGCVLS